MERGRGARNIHSAEGDNLLDARGRVRLDSRDGRVEPQRALHDVNTNNNRVGLVEDGDGAEYAGEHSQHLGLLLLALVLLTNVLGKRVEQVVNNIGRKD